MYDRMVTEHGYSVRKLAQKLGKDKGYVENRLRLADAPEEIKELVSVRKDTLSHAYELLKVSDPRRRKRLAEQVAAGELTLIKLRDRVEGRRARPVRPAEDADDGASAPDDQPPKPNGQAPQVAAEEEEWSGHARGGARGEDSLISAKQGFADALEELVEVLTATERTEISEIDRTNLAKYLTIAKIRLENAIALVKSGATTRP
jgi:ParB-like chromosome segregation protein Spo0J